MTIAVAYMAMRTQTKINSVVTKVNGVVAQAEEVKADLAVVTGATKQSLSEITKVVVSSHKLVNGGRRQQLELTALAYRELAEAKPTPRNRAASELAERMLATHIDLEEKADETVAAVLESPEETVAAVVASADVTSIAKRQAEQKGSIHE